ncbi:1-deoxy-D-xylulose-5-phosphate synthase [Desulfovulcanus sp.]
MHKNILARIENPQDVSSLSLSELTELAKEIRELIIEVVAKNGGHLAPSLGVVELTLALLKVFDPGQDKFIWDVGHQAYAYKILTGRKENFHTLRCFGGISGFPKPSESVYDHFGVGHSSTSISAALGMAVARDILGQRQKVLAIIGDGSMTAGLAYEGLNQAGDLDKDLVVILNDNEMSIAKNVGALSSFLSRKLSSRWVLRLKKEMEAWMRQIPKIGDDLVHYARRSEESLKSFFTPGMLFEAFKFNYLGPVDGHDLKRLIEFFEQIKDLEGPVLVHVLTKKGKGYKPAETNPTYFHGVGCFEPETGAAKKFGFCSLPSYTDVFGQTLCSLAEKDDRIVAITAAMPEGTGLSNFAQKFPDRFFDVGICEQHAVTFAAGLATKGFKPVVAIYSTFLQRSYDQIVHDVCLQNLPVTFCLDRGGIVGEDGPTHHGAFDLSYLRHIPNMTLMAPKDEAELQDLLYTAINYPGPAALRYPRGVGVGARLKDNLQEIPLGTGELLREGRDGVIITIGSRVYPALEAAQELEKEKGLQIAVYNARFVKPLPEDDLRGLALKFNKLLLVEENVLAGGFSSAVLEFLADNDLLSNLKIKRVALPDKFIEHGPQKLLRQMLGLGKDGIKKSLLGLLG